MNRLKYFTALALVLPLYGNPAQAYTAQNFSASSSIMQMIYTAAVEKDAARIHNLIARGYSINAYDERGYTALCEAIVQGNDDAYDFLVEQGADEKASCVENAEDEHSSVRNARILRYGGTTLLLGGIVGGAFAMSSGGGSGGSSSSGSSSSGTGTGTSTVTFTPGSNGEVDSSRDWSTAASAVLNSTGKVETYYTEAELRADNEFNAYIKSQTATIGEYNYTLNTVNYLDAINAAPAFAEYYGTDADGNFASSLSQNVKLGIIDTGVWGSHTEFQTSEGSKISGYNYDYGPCLNDDTTNCWKATGTVSCDNDGKCAQSVVLLDGEGDETEESAVSCSTGSSAVTCNPYNVWASGYPEDYDWDNLEYYFYPNNVNEKIADAELDMDETEVLHGTHVTGIMVSNKDGKGNMGILPANATVSAVRWDFMSSLYNPLMKMLNDNVVAVNMSLGTEADADSNASQAKTGLSGYSDSGELEAYKAIINSYKDKTNSYTKVTGKDGMIIVKAAGNESYSEPDLESGIKLNSDYSDLMMLVVVSADVSVSDGKVTNYSLSGFSSQCGSTSSYCIAAPGGNESINSTEGTISASLIYSAGEVADGTSDYDYMGGTSQATPLVTGSIGFLKAAYPYMSSSEIIDLILETANTGATDYTEAKYGAGLLDLGAAVSTYLSENGKITTTASSSLSGEKISLSSARLNVPATFKTAVQKALPKTITAFDKYARPFAMPTANYVSSTHSGYKNLKNDVFNISRRKKLQKVDSGAFSFAFSGSAQNVGGQGLGFASAEYKNGTNVSGFYFSENTKYGADEYVEKGLNNPFMSFNSAYGVYNTFAFNKNSGLKLEAVTGRNGLYDGERSFQDDTFRKQAYALNAELQLHKGKKFGFGLSSGILYEDDALLGMNGDGAFALSSGSTYNTGVTAQWFVTPKLTLSGSYFTGFTKADSFASNLLRTSNLISESFALDANYRFDKTLDFGLSLSSPLRVRSGTLSIDFPAGRDSYSDEVYRERLQASLKPEAREYKISAYFNKELTEKLSLRSEAGVRINPDHQRTDSDYRILFGMSWDFN